MNYKRASKSAFSKLAGCFIGTSSSSSSSRGVSASTNALVVDDADHQNPNKKPALTGFFNDPLENAVEVGKYDISQSEAILAGHNNDSAILENDGHTMLVHGEEQSQSVQQSEVSSAEAEAFPLTPDDLAMLSNYMQQSDSSSLEFEAALLNPDDLSYLGLHDGPGPMGNSPTSTISNNDCYSENMKTGEDDELEDNSFSPWTEDIFAHEPDPSSSAGPSQSIPLIGEIEKTTELFKDFKPFDTVIDPSDHHFVKIHQPGKFFHIIPSRQKSPPEIKQLALKERTKRVQHEWRILEKDLPDTVYVRAYEERMDLLRAVIVGAAGTPYHDGLFFFDIGLPQDYPHSPPMVHYHSFGYRVNPNLYACGRVCLSLLNTWPGSRVNHETWIPKRSTILQVLVSIQALVLNEKPYFNEPGYEASAGKEVGERHARAYNENTFILCLKSMLHLLRKPPKHFESFVAGYFRDKAPCILEACKAYMEGAQVGHLAGDRVQSLDQGHGYCSKSFKDSLSHLFPQLVTAFTDNGADCQKFVPKPKESRQRKLLVKVWN